MARKAWVAGILAGAFVAGAGCLNVEAPREISVGTGRSSQERIDATHVPETKSHEEARQELRKAYYRIGELQRENDRLRKDRDDYKSKYNKLKDKYEH